MPEITLEGLAARVTSLEQQLAEQKAARPDRKKDWRRSVGMFDGDPDFAQEVLAEAQAIREAERQVARQGPSE